MTTIVIVHGVSVVKTIVNEFYEYAKIYCMSEMPTFYMYPKWNENDYVKQNIRNRIINCHKIFFKMFFSFAF